MKRLLDEPALRSLARGCAVLGAGGGGDPHIGLLLALQARKEVGPTELVDLDDLPDDALIMPCGMVGAPTVPWRPPRKGCAQPASFPRAYRAARYALHRRHWPRTRSRGDGERERQHGRCAALTQQLGGNRHRPAGVYAVVDEEHRPVRRGQCCAYRVRHGQGVPQRREPLSTVVLAPRRTLARI